MNVADICKGYRPEARGINHINHELKVDKRLIFFWPGFLKGCKSALTKNASVVHLSSVFLTLHAGTGGIDKFLGFLIMLVFQSRISI